MKTKTKNSGKLHVRMPAALHGRLKAEAAKQGVSLNTWVVTLLAGGTGFKLAEPNGDGK